MDEIETEQAPEPGVHMSFLEHLDELRAVRDQFPCGHVAQTSDYQGYQGYQDNGYPPDHRW